MFTTKRKDVSVRMTQRLWRAVMSSLASQKPVLIALKFGLSSMIYDATNQNLLQPQSPFPRCIVICCCKITLCCHVNRKRNNNKCNNDKWIKHWNENMTALFQYCSQAKSGVKTFWSNVSSSNLHLSNVFPVLGTRKVSKAARAPSTHVSFEHLVSFRDTLFPLC